MLQRQLRVGDIVDDYCPRERRLSDHAIVAMVGDTVRQTRCTTCDAEHEYKNAKVPVSRKKKAEAPLPPKALASPTPAGTPPADADGDAPAPLAVAELEPGAADPVTAEADPVEPPADSDGEADRAAGHDGPVHRRLIRATLPRVEGQEVSRPIPEFTMHRVPAGRGGSHGKGFKHPSGHQRQGGRSAHGSGFGPRGHGGGQGQSRGGHRPQGGHGGRHGHPGAGSGRRKKH